MILPAMSQQDKELTLSDFQQQVAKEKGHRDFESAKIYGSYHKVEIINNEAAEAYASYRFEQGIREASILNSVNDLSFEQYKETYFKGIGFEDFEKKGFLSATNQARFHYTVEEDELMYENICNQIANLYANFRFEQGKQEGEAELFEKTKEYYRKGLEDSRQVNYDKGWNEAIYWASENADIKYDASIGGLVVDQETILNGLKQEEE